MFQVLYFRFCSFFSATYFLLTHTLHPTLAHRDTISYIFKFPRKFNFYQESLKRFAYGLLQNSICSLIECIKEIHLNCIRECSMPVKAPRATVNIFRIKREKSTIEQPTTSKQQLRLTMQLHHLPKTVSFFAAEFALSLHFKLIARRVYT